MKKYLIGASKTADINVTTKHNSISRHHAELIRGKDNTYLLIDRNSTNGTYVSKNGKWLKIRQQIVDLNTKVILGRYRTDVNYLLTLARKSK